MLFSERALALITDFEGVGQPGVWPGGGSGITLGYGYDLGFVRDDEFRAAWAGCFTADEERRLAGVVRLKGQAARAAAAGLAGIRCRKADARRVLVDVSLPDYLAQTRRAFPGFDVLPLDVQGALVSLVYNRGASMTDKPGTDNRREMRAIRDLVGRGLVIGIADQLRSMKRLWVGMGLDGLLRRRDAEADLVDAAMAAMRRAITAVPVPVARVAATARRTSNTHEVSPRARRAVVLAMPHAGARPRRRRPQV
jgi:GH24 family phage-related lysozyme (muramidase)